MDYGKVFTRAWQIIWKNRVLWIFGILASCGSGGSSFNYSQRTNVQTGSGDFGDLPPEVERAFLQIERFFQNTPQETLILWGVGIFCAFLLLALITWAIGVFGRVGVIRGASLADAGKSFSFGSLAGESWHRLWGALGMNFLLGLIPAAASLTLLLIFGVIFIGIVSDSDGNFGLAILCLAPLFCILFLFMIPYSIYIQVANVSYVSEGLNSTQAIRKGWQVFRNNLGSVLIVALILFVGSILVGLVLALPFIFIAAPTLFGMFAGNEGSLTNGLIISAICLVIAIPILVVLQGILQSYIQSAWTLAYSQMTGTKPVARRKARA